MKELNINIGSEYLVDHCRKGKFFGRLEFYDEEWLVFVVTRGKPGAALAYNEKDIGEEVIVRKGFCSLTEIK